MPLGELYPPAEHFGVLDGFFNMLVWVAASCHPPNLIILLTLVNGPFPKGNLNNTRSLALRPGGRILD
jgi:hypothetical protein